MEHFPKQVKNFKLGDRVICVSEKHENMFMNRGTIRYIGNVQKMKGIIQVVDFDKTIKSKEDTRLYGKTKPGCGAFLEGNCIYLLQSEKFDEAGFKKSLLNQKLASSKVVPNLDVSDAHSMVSEMEQNIPQTPRKDKEPVKTTAKPGHTRGAPSQNFSKTPEELPRPVETVKKADPPKTRDVSPVPAKKPEPVDLRDASPIPTGKT